MAHTSMEKKKPTTANGKGACEKLFDALSATPSFRPFRRITNQSQDHVPAPGSAAPKPPPTSLLPSSVAQNKKPSHGHLPSPPPPSTTNQKEKPKAPIVSAQDKSHTEKVGHKIDFATHPASGQQVSGKPKGTVDTSTLVKTVVQQGKEIAGKVDTKVKEKIAAGKVEQPDKSHKEKVGHKIDLATNPASDQHVTGKPKGKVDTSTLIKTVVQQGKDIAGKVDTKVKEKIAAGKVEQPEVAPTKAESGRKGALANMNEKANDYIARAKYKIRPSGGADGGRTT